ncbi:MAG: peptidylprolyl isomerase [Clostridia bacterium]|nr:peptidylprolyl isomerase [Clostridia bacterium]
MNKFKKIIVTAMALLMTFVCAISFVGCGKDIKDVDVRISVYNFTDNVYEDYSLDIELYGHLAPTTVAQISSLIKSGYYNDTVFYKMSKYDDQLMLGDLKYDPENQENCGFYLNAEKPTIKGEFKYGGTTGSNLKNKEGSIGLWRTWAAQDDSYNAGYNSGSTGMDTGSATWFIPTKALTAYDDYFCVFGQYDVNDEDNKETITDIKALFSNTARYQEFVIYYTGEYGNLTFHCVKAEDFDKEEIVDLFEAEEDSAELVCYNNYTIKVPMTSDGRVAAKIVRAQMD